MYSLENTPHLHLSRYIEQNLKSVFISLYHPINREHCNNISAIEMVNKGKLEGWCWQSTTFLSIFLGNEDIVSRGKLSTLPTYSKGDYFHSWIEIKYGNDKYVFDPSLNYLDRKDHYYTEFSAKVLGQVQAMNIRTSLVDLVENVKEEAIYISGTNKIDDPFFRTNSKTLVKIGSNNEIEQLNVRFYSEE
ncbi:MAG: hypothetical protein PHX34_01280 [Candidatus Shapirobacteria bacterium]|nr:hypothetical protein [Candidatus Shapirobacteria bacterium]